MSLFSYPLILPGHWSMCLTFSGLLMGLRQCNKSINHFCCFQYKQYWNSSVNLGPKYDTSMKLCSMELYLHIYCKEAFASPSL